MKNNIRLVFAWVLFALMALVGSVNAAPKVHRITSVISNESPYISFAFQVTDAALGGTRYLIQARGLPAKATGPLDPEIMLYSELPTGELRLIFGNDDWRSRWNSGSTTTASQESGVNYLQRIVGAAPLSNTDSALSLLLPSGNYLLVVQGWGRSVGTADVAIYEANETPVISQETGTLPFFTVGQSVMIGFKADDPDNDDVEFLFDLDGNGTVDLVSPRIQSGRAYWPTFIKCDEVGAKRFNVWARDTKGAISLPFRGSVNVIDPDRKG